MEQLPVSPSPPTSLVSLYRSTIYKIDNFHLNFAPNFFTVLKNYALLSTLRLGGGEGVGGREERVSQGRGFSIN